MTSLDKKLLKWQIKEGISGVTVCGTTGESPTLSHDEHMTLVEFLESLVRIAIKHPECTSENPPEKLKELLALLFEDEKRTKSKVANMFGGGGGKKKGGGFAGMFGMKKKK